MMTGGEISNLMDPRDEILWNEVGLFISDDDLRQKFKGGGSVLNPVQTNFSREQINDTFPEQHPSVLCDNNLERELLFVIDESHILDLNFP